jgi:hypothetical protein
LLRTSQSDSFDSLLLFCTRVIGIAPIVIAGHEAILVLSLRASKTLMTKGFATLKPQGSASSAFKRADITVAKTSGEVTSYQ